MGYRYHGALIIPQEYETLFEQGLNYYHEHSKSIPKVSDFDKSTENDFVIYAFDNWRRGWGVEWEVYAEKLMNWIVGSNREDNIEEGFEKNPWEDFDNSAMKFAMVDGRKRAPTSH